MEKAILVGLDTGDDVNFVESMEELKNLTLACDVEVLEQMVQKADSPTSKFYIGSGKIQELKELITTIDANLVIFDNELSPSHIRNIEEALDCKVIDRTILILDIFARRAKTKAAMLQVELAQSEYMLPRVVGLYKSLSRQKSGTGSKGPGEQQLEIDRRILRDRITKLKHDLEDIVDIRRTQREKRKKSEIKTVALSGYTNSGKSTLMNSLLTYSIVNQEKYVFEKDMLFATLDTQTRNITLENNHSFLITDTVGFISKLPHNLIEAFKSTLEEIKEASLILHVIDVSNPYYMDQINVVEEVLKDIGIENIPLIYVFNKIDLLTDIPLTNHHPYVFISATEKTNLYTLVEMIDQELNKTNHLVKMLLPYDKGQIYSFLKETANIIDTEYVENGITLEVEISDVIYNKYKEYIL
jgi:GTP-binding protein HflX